MRKDRSKGAEEAGAGGAGGAWEMVDAASDRLPRQVGEGRRFLGLRRQTVAGDGMHRDGTE